MLKINFVFIVILILQPFPVNASGSDYCTSKRLDWAICQQQIRDGSRSPNQPCESIPPECYGGGNSRDCTSERLDWLLCLQNARDSGLEPSVCGGEPVCN